MPSRYLDRNGGHTDPHPWARRRWLHLRPGLYIHLGNPTLEGSRKPTVEMPHTNIVGPTVESRCRLGVLESAAFTQLLPSQVSERDGKGAMANSENTATRLLQQPHA